MKDAEFWTTLWLTFQLATFTTSILLLIGIPIAVGLAGYKGRLKPIWEAMVSLPLVLPPTVMGFYLLLAFSPNAFLGKLWESATGVRLVFSFPGLVIGSVIYSLPFMVQPLQSALQGLPQSLKEAAYVLGKSRWQTLVKVILPNIRPSILTGIVLSFAHTVGEFGVILMIGGGIPGHTKVASIAVFNEVEALHYAEANRYSFILLLFSFIILVLAYWFQKK